MARPPKPTPPFDTQGKKIQQLEYLVARICETLKINYDLDD